MREHPTVVVLAKDLCRQAGFDPDRQLRDGDDLPVPAWKGWVDPARTAIASHTSSIYAPSDAMLDAAAKALSDLPPDKENALQIFWEVMLYTHLWEIIEAEEPDK